MEAELSLAVSRRLAYRDMPPLVGGGGADMIDDSYRCVGVRVYEEIELKFRMAATYVRPQSRERFRTKCSSRRTSRCLAKLVRIGVDGGAAAHVSTGANRRFSR